MSVRALALVLLLANGCGGSLLSRAEVPDACRGYDDSYLAWKAVGVAAAGLAGATGTSGVLTATLADEQGADIALAASSAVMGVLSTVAGVLAGEYAERVSTCAATQR